MNKRAAGFTLLEVLLALTICMMLVSLVYGGLRVGMRSWEASQQQAENGHMRRVSWQFLHRSLTRATRFTDPRKEQSSVLFEGDQRQLTFVTELPSYLSRSGLHVLQLLSEDTEHGEQLILHYAPLTVAEQSGFESLSSTSVLVENLEAVKLRYFGTPHGADAPGWQTVWSGEEQLPELVQIQIRSSHGEEWPVLLAHPEQGVSRKISLTQLLNATLHLKAFDGL